MNLLKNISRIFGILLLCMFFYPKESRATPPLTKQLDAEVATQWMELQLKLIQSTPGFSPPVASRALAYSSLALYESVVNGMPEYQSLAGILNGFKGVHQPEWNKEYHWALVANAAQASILKNLYANTSAANQKSIDSLKASFERRFQRQLPEEVVNRSAKLGESIAKDIFEYSKSDGGHEGYRTNYPKNYKIVTGACVWTPTQEQTLPLQPFWGQNRMFVQVDAMENLPKPPPCEAGLSSLLYAQALEVYSVGKNLSAEQKEIAYFWSDDAGKTFTPPGHALSITTQIIKKEKVSLEKATETYCKVSLAVADAFISCWKCKFMYHLMRPISYIRTTIDRNWSPLLVTPPFPEYSSGHASCSGAAAQVLSDLFGFNYAFTDYSHARMGLAPRHFDSFADFANEAANSRLYGGIHYRNSNEQGLKNGKRIGKNVCELKFKKV